MKPFFLLFLSCILIFSLILMPSCGNNNTAEGEDELAESSPVADEEPADETEDTPPAKEELPTAKDTEVSDESGVSADPEPVEDTAPAIVPPIVTAPPAEVFADNMDVTQLADEVLRILGSGCYYLDVSVFSDGEIIYNTLAMRDGAIESLAVYGGITSHSLYLDGVTYVLDDKRGVYFAVPADGGALQGSVDYTKAVFIGTGEDDLSFGGPFAYADYRCETYDGYECGVRFYFDENNTLIAIEDYMDEEAVERDVAAFSSEIPTGCLVIPEGYTRVSSDVYFEQYYYAE